MFSVGWTWKRVILMQIVSQSFAFLGLCIGVPVAESSEGATQWILMLAAGMFLYVALCDIVSFLFSVSFVIICIYKTPSAGLPYVPTGISI